MGIRDPCKLLKIVPYNKELDFEDIKKAIDASIFNRTEERIHPLDRLVKLYTGRGGMEMFQSILQKDVDKFGNVED